ncbi:MAG: penicillin acylase family protein [Rhodospirillales bacterium]|nr:penicillin acylase family protein [Rhodospirillales bacterium]
MRSDWSTATCAGRRSHCSNGFFYGRLSELVGQFAFKIDHLIRILDYGRAADELEQRMPQETRDWVQGYVDGLNAQQDYLQTINRQPPELGVLGIKPEPYTFRDDPGRRPIRRRPILPG